ncbi:MAG TPA: MCE family protein, partial [Marmoricola sp.]
PTLVADRFVQLVPAYTGGAVLKNGGEIPLDRTNVPLELDQIYSSLADLTKTLGPRGANKHGALGDVLHAGAQALKGNGELGNETIANLARAAQTLGDNSDQIFGTVGNLAQLTSTLQANDKVVGGFMTRLSKVTGELSGERGDLRKALVAIANAVGVVRSFVHDNKTALITDIRKLTTTVGVLAKHKKTLATLLQIAPLGLGNLLDAGDPQTGSVGIRLQLGPTASALPTIVCDVLKVNAGSSGAALDPLCNLLNEVLPNVPTNIGAGLINVPSMGSGSGSSSSSQRPATNLGDLMLRRQR